MTRHTTKASTDVLRDSFSTVAIHNIALPRTRVSFTRQLFFASFEGQFIRNCNQSRWLAGENRISIFQRKLFGKNHRPPIELLPEQLILFYQISERRKTFPDCDLRLETHSNSYCLGARGKLLNATLHNVIALWHNFSSPISFTANSNYRKNIRQRRKKANL